MHGLMVYRLFTVTLKNLFFACDITDEFNHFDPFLKKKVWKNNDFYLQRKIKMNFISNSKNGYFSCNMIATAPFLYFHMREREKNQCKNVILFYRQIVLTVFAFDDIPDYTKITPFLTRSIYQILFNGL